jgi:hypothetical protein
VGEDGCEVECGDGVEEEVDEVALGEPVVWRGREEVVLVGGPIAIGLGYELPIATEKKTTIFTATVVQ